jgi:glucose/arabinose dehydrogenase
MPRVLARPARRGAVSLCLLALLAIAVLAASSEENVDLAKIRLPPGFQISLYARAPGARSMTWGSSGMLFVGTRNEGRVYAIASGAAGKGGEVLTIASGLNIPNGVAFRDGALYVAEIGRILRYDGIETKLKSPPSPVVVNADFPKDTHHGWKFIAFGPDGWLYVPVGAPCNICDPAPVYAAIHRIKPDGTGLETVARGVRNTVGFDWHPRTKELWFTDNGRDWLGDDRPPDELNHAPRAGLHFGFPYCHGRDLRDPKFGEGKDCASYAAPAVELDPHVAAIGMRFYTGRMFPEKYRNQIFIAEHGSWNRSTPIGYRVMLAALSAGRAPTYEVFAEGWLEKAGTARARPWGRPADVLVAPDGALLVSDDRAGAIYRISYRGAS